MLVRESPPISRVCTPVHPPPLLYHSGIILQSPELVPPTPQPTRLTTSLASSFTVPHLVQETQTRLKIQGFNCSKVAGAGASVMVGAELLEVATPPNPSRALSPGVQPASVPAAQVEGSLHPHSHRCKHRTGVLLRLRTFQTCVPAKLCGSANPERRITRPGPGGAQRTRTPLPTGEHAPNQPRPSAPTAMRDARVAVPQPHPNRQ